MLDIPEKEPWIKRLIMPATLMIGILALLWLGLTSWQVLSRSTETNINIAEVSSGNVQATVSGYGRLLPRQSSSLISEVDGTITSIERYPGTAVEPGDVIFILRNPMLEREREGAELAVLEAMAAGESAAAALQRETIALENDIEIVQSELRFAERELETMEVLMEQRIMARLDYLRAETSVEQARLRLSLNTRNFEAFKQSREADQRAYEYRLEGARKQLAIVEYDIEQLIVRADREGLLNELGEGIETGSPIQRGQVVAQITDPDTLYADLLISASDASRVQNGQSVLVNIRGEPIQGEVLRIHPSAQNNQVRLEVIFDQRLPASSRANLDVSARIITEQVGDVIRVTPPLYLTRGHISTDVFVQSGDSFQRREVTFGVLSGEYVEVISGLQPEEQILLDLPAPLRERQLITRRELQ